MKRKKAKRRAAKYAPSPKRESHHAIIGRWYRELYGATPELRAKEADAFEREWHERRDRWRAEYGEELPVNVDQWERLLSRVGLTPQEVCDVMAGIPDIDLVINHVEGYLERVKRDTPMRVIKDSDEYRPARWFRKGTADRLRQAAAKSRKTKRVRSKKVDGVVCYCVADVRRWWPDALPKGS